MRSSRVFACACFVAGGALGAWASPAICVSAANLIQNCAFDQGLNTAYPSQYVPMGWTELGTWDQYDALTQAQSLEPGGYSVKNGDAPPNLTGVGQTISDVAGQNYLLTFWVFQDGDNTTGPGQDYGAEWNGNVVGYETDQPASTSWTDFSYVVTGTGSDFLSLGGDSYHGYNYLDDVSLVATPEGPSLVYGLLGLAALGVRMGRARGATRDTLLT